MSVKSVLFGEKEAKVYLKSEIFFPDSDNITDPSTSGKIVPAVGSIVVDNTNGLHNQLYVVTDVNQLTYFPTLIPASYVINDDAQVDRVLSYGNDVFMLYFSTVTKTIDNSDVVLTRLIVDNKLSLFGKHAATYQLIQTDDNGSERIISRKYIAGSNNNLVPDGKTIPMSDTGVDGIRKCDGCYTDAMLQEGEEIRCDVFTAGGLLIAQINLIAKKAHLLNETVNTSNPIVGMVINGTQQLSNGDLYLFRGQNPKELGIYVDLKYADGTTSRVAIDNRRGFCYGLDDVSSSIDDTEFQILIKYYLSDSDATGTIVDGSLETDTITHFITNTAKIKIISGAKDLISKVSPIPRWDTVAGEWKLDFLRYRDSRRQTPYASSVSTNPEYVSIVNGFNGKLFNAEQTVTIMYKEVTNNLGTIAEKTASFIIELRDPRNTTATGKNFWLIKDNANAPTYGDYTGAHRRPRITYVDSTITANKGYFIPANIFAANTSQTAVEVFLENFYSNANPPKRTDESIAPTPTHFRVKKVDGTLLTLSTVPVDEFTNNLNLIIPQGSNANYLIGQTVVVEFLKEIDRATCEYLYGVPVDVIE